MCETLVVISLVLVPFVIYGVVWLLGRAFYAGKLSAIRSAFYKRKRRRP